MASILVTLLTSQLPNIPIAYVLIESNGISKHDLHIDNATNIPTTYILIKHFGKYNHTIHVHNAAYVPATYVLVESISTLKCIRHIGNAAAHIPITYIVIEHFGTTKHKSIFVTLLTSQRLMSSLKEVSSRNGDSMLVTIEVFHTLISP